MIYNLYGKGELKLKMELRLLMGDYSTLSGWTQGSQNGPYEWMRASEYECWSDMIQDKLH